MLLNPQVRFKHDPSSPHGYVGAALSSNVIHFTKDEASGKWVHNVAIRQPWVKVGEGKCGGTYGTSCSASSSNSGWSFEDWVTLAHIPVVEALLLSALREGMYCARLTLQARSGRYVDCRPS